MTERRNAQKLPERALNSGRPDARRISRREIHFLDGGFGRNAVGLGIASRHGATQTDLPLAVHAIDPRRRLTGHDLHQIIQPHQPPLARGT